MSIPDYFTSTSQAKSFVEYLVEQDVVGRQAFSVIEVLDTTYYKSRNPIQNARLARSCYIQIIRGASVFAARYNEHYLVWCTRERLAGRMNAEGETP
jgi:hypothetical protein